MRKNFDFLPAYLEKHYNDQILKFDILDLLDRCKDLQAENQFLKDQLCDLQQSVEPEHQWENILTAQLSRAAYQNKTDCLEISSSSGNNETWIITVQKKHGKTPQQLQRQAEIRRQKAARKIVNLHQENRELQAKLSQQNQDLQVFHAISSAWAVSNSTPEMELKTRWQIEKAKTFVEKCIQSYNAYFYRQHFAELHTSTIHAFQEAWSRASRAFFELEKMKLELKLYKQLLNDSKKHRPFQKYRHPRKIIQKKKFRHFC
jgi:hypothetical protein